MLHAVPSQRAPEFIRQSSLANAGGWLDLEDGTKATRAAWFLKARQLPGLYWHVMLKGHKWMAKPARRSV